MIPALHIAAETRRKERLARDTVAGSLLQAEAQQERLNVNTLIDRDRAIERAEAIDAMVEAGTDPGPLAGVPVALKDLIDHAGRPTKCGSSFYSEVPDRSARVVERLEQAGAVIVTRTGLHEFAYGFNSENEWFGPVRNPLDPELSTGGSSGGSAAAVAGEQVPVAIGTDTGGSVRVPAALCGIYGLKVTHGRVPLTGVFPLASSLDTVGPLARTIDDLSLAYLAIAGYDASDPWSVDQPVVRPGSARPDLQGLRIGLPVAWLDRGPVTDQVAEAFAEAVAAIRGMGATVQELHDPVLAPPGHIAELAGGEIAALHRRWKSEGKQYGTEVSARLDAALDVDLDAYVEANRWRAEVRQHAAAAFFRFDLLLTPTTGATRKTIGVDAIETSTGQHHHRTVLSWFTALVNTIGAPALAAPLTSDQTPPPSLQLIGPWWTEHRLLEVGATLAETGITH